MGMALWSPSHFGKVEAYVYNIQYVSWGSSLAISVVLTEYYMTSMPSFFGEEREAHEKSFHN